MCEQALHYRDHREEYLSKHRGRFVAIADGNVVLDLPDLSEVLTRSQLTPGHPGKAIFLKYVTPEEEDDENYTVYEELLK